MAEVAEQVFDRYGEAPVRAATELAEKFLRAGSLTAISTPIDPLGLVQVNAGKASIRTDYKALVSIRDHIDRLGVVEGKSLSDRFADAPFGWSQDTLRYLLSALLLAGEVKLKVGGREVTVNGQQAIDALKTNNTFKSVGVSLREDKPSMEMLALASTRLTELCGDLVVPLEDAISKATTKLFPTLQQRYAPLAEKLKSLSLPGVDRLDSLSRDIADVLLTDASDAPQRLGKQDSALYENLKWTAEVRNSLEQGLEQTLRDLLQHRSAIEGLPQTDIPAQLKDDLGESFAQLDQRLKQLDFHCHSADFNTRLTHLRSQVSTAATSMQSAQAERLKEAEVDLQRVPEWVELTLQEQQELLGKLEGLILQVQPNISGLQALVNRDYEIHNQVQQLKQRIERLGRERLQERIKSEQQDKEQEGAPEAKTITRSFKARARITSLSDLDAMIQALQKLKSELKFAHAFELDVQVEE